MLELSGGPRIELGPVQHAVTGAVLEGPNEVEPGVFEATISYSPENEQVMTRLTQDQPQTDASERAEDEIAP